LWFHVDGAFGALAALSPALRPRLAGLELADSIALDFHKWAHVPYDAGFLLVRDADLHRDTFASAAAYLTRAPRGLAAGETWPCDLGPDLSRGFRALKTWFTFKVHGADKIGRAIEANCEAAGHLERAIEGSPIFELRAPVRLNVVCFALKARWPDAANEALVIDLQERGVAAPSMTRLAGRPVIRAAIVNHRTTKADIDHFVLALHDAAERLVN
jgi:aromatic-L-amino-acid/L-tryptophan decarboxylase